MSVAPAKLITGDELLRLGLNGPVELIEGVLTPMSPTQNLHGWIVMELARRLGNFNAERGLGWVLGAESGLVTRHNPDTVRGMDIAFVSHQRLPVLKPGFLETAPELIVEVVSPSDRWTDIRSKLMEYFDAGVDRVWIIEPEQRKVLVFRSLTDLSELTAGDTVRGEGLLSGFALPLTELFPAQPPASPHSPPPGA